MHLSPEEVRVLGCLIEKSQATPEYYPMTLNALVAACNQKSSRDPVVSHSSEEVEEAVALLREKGLCAFISGEGRALKYAHRCGENGLELTQAQQAALSLMLLRGPQTVGEIKNRSGRQNDFASLEEVQENLHALINREPPLVEQAPRQAGQKEVRFRHMYFVYPESSDSVAAEPAASSLREEIEALKEKLAQALDRLEEIEATVARMKADLY